jgi:hypothetical protein
MVDFVMPLENGAAREVPLFEAHKRGRNWMAKIEPNPSAPGGLRREFFERARGDYYYLIPPGSLAVGDALEFGADYYSGSGRKNARRWYGAVAAVADDRVELVRAEDGRKAVELGERLRREASGPGRVIVSRHPAAVEFIRRAAPEFAGAPVLAEAKPEDVRGKIVAGNLPLHLAALAEEVWAVEFEGEPPRGREYGLEEMLAAGAALRRYRVRAL